MRHSLTLKISTAPALSFPQILKIACMASRSALDPIDLSPFLPSWNLNKVELFSAFISHLDDISSWKFESASLLNLKEKIHVKDSRNQTHILDGPVYYTNH